MYRGVEQELGEGALCLFAQGGAGDINPLIMGRSGDAEKDYPLVGRMGELLANEVMNSLKRMKGVTGKSERVQALGRVITVAHRWEPEKILRLGTVSLLINGEIGIVTLP